MQPGQCTLPPDATGRFLDRLAGLEQIIPPEAVRQALAATGRTNQRRCKLTHEVVCWVVLAMGILTDLPIRQVFKHARRFASARRPPSVQPVRGPATPGHRPGPPLVRADRSSPGPARDARGLLPRVPPGGARWHGL